MSRDFSLWERLSRLARHRLVVPIKRSPHPPEHTARAVMFGVFWAMTPLVGVQMYLVFFTWLACRRSEKLNFSLIIGLAWTWISNVFTMWPLYYVFYVTGKFLLGRLDTASGYEGFVVSEVNPEFQNFQELRMDALLWANNGIDTAFFGIPDSRDIRGKHSEAAR